MANGPQFQPVQTVRAYQRIVEQVEEALARGDLAPGQRLPSERELVAQFAVSRSTVREALRVLESNGVVRSRPGDPNGPEILPFSHSALRVSWRNQSTPAQSRDIHRSLLATLQMLNSRRT